MKKLIIVILLCAAGMVAHSQVIMKSRYHKNLDTITNTGAKTLTVPVAITGPAQSVTVTTKNVQLTGTMAGIGRLWGSVDGVTYQRLRTYQLHNLQVDSCLIDAAHPVFGWVIDNNPYHYYQVIITGVGTSTYTTASYLLRH